MFKSDFFLASRRRHQSIFAVLAYSRYALDVVLFPKISSPQILGATKEKLVLSRSKVVGLIRSAHLLVLSRSKMCETCAFHYHVWLGVSSADECPIQGSSSKSLLNTVVVSPKKQLIKYLCYMNAFVVNERPHDSNDVSKAGHLESASDMNTFIYKRGVWIIHSLAGGQKIRVSFVATTHYLFGSQLGSILKPLYPVAGFEQY